MKQEEHSTNAETTTVNGSTSSGSSSSTTIATSDAVKTEKTETDSDRPPPIDAASKSLPKAAAVFPPETIREKLSPILHRLWDHEEGFWFHQPVTEAIAPGYFDIIKCPMDFSTIFKKLEDGQYVTPFQFCEDICLVFKNAWTFNKKSQRVYKAGLKVRNYDY